MGYTGLFKLYPKPGTSEDGFVSYDKDVIKQSIMTLIKTPKGSRIYDPLLGTDLHRLIHDLNLKSIQNVAKAEILNVIEKYEPRVDLLNVGVYVEGETDQILVIFLHFRYKEYNDEEILELRMASEQQWIKRDTPDPSWDAADPFASKYFARNMGLK